MQVFSFTKYLINNKIDEIINIHPSYNSVMVSLSSNMRIKQVLAFLEEAIPRAKDEVTPKRRDLKVPVVYGGEYGPDLKRVSKHSGLNESQVIERHSQCTYLVYFIGFSIGFPYLGGMDESISTPRLDSPRKRVDSGHIGIAGGQTGIYPLSSPGGWNLIGKTPINVFNINDPDSSFLRMGDRLKFFSIEESKFEEYKN